jgi:hypothetical protein
MSEFISVYHLILGTRPVDEPVVSFGLLPSMYDIEQVASPISVELMASAIDMGDIYHFDAFERFGKAEDEAKCRIKKTLAVFGEMLMTGSPDENRDFIYGLHDMNNVPDWHRFGWLDEDLPNFDASHEKWKSAHGMKGKQPPSFKQPAPQNHIWRLARGLLKTVIGDDAYRAATKGHFSQAVSALQREGFRWNDSEKTALRRHIRAIVESAP